MPRWHTVFIVLLWLVVYFCALFAPSLLDDADATHANAARHMAQTGDYVTLYVNGIRYLEKAPLPYWMSAVSFRIFGFNVFAAHLPVALAVLAMAWLAYCWALRAWGERAALYASSAVLTSVGVFLFTRTLIPEAMLAVLLPGALFCFLRALNGSARRVAYLGWACIAIAALAKGLIAPVFVFAALLLFLTTTKRWAEWRKLAPFAGLLMFVAIAAPWHVLAGMRNTGGDHGHGFFWFYFVNEHFLRFLGKRIPHDYNKLPWYLYWSLHVAWLFPWSFFWPAAAAAWWKERKDDTARMLACFAGFVLVFFALSTNQEYYTFPAYVALLMLTMGGLVLAERDSRTHASRRLIVAGHAALTLTGIAISAALAAGLWSSRALPFEPDAGALLAHRGVGDYTLSMSHFFDLTGRSFAALRLPAVLAAVAFATGPALGWWLRRRGRDVASTLTIALTSALFLIAAHIALGRFGTMLSSEQMEARFEQLRAEGVIAPDAQLMLYGDQAYGSSVAFYAGRVLPLVEGRSTSLWFGSTFPDAPDIFLTKEALQKMWGRGPEHVLFVPLEKRDEVDRLLGDRQVVLMEQSGKALIADRNAGAAR